MNIQQIEARERDLEHRAADLRKRIGDATLKGISRAEMPLIKAEFNAIESERAAIAAERENHQKVAKMAGFGNAKGYDGPAIETKGVLPLGAKGYGRDVYPLAVSRSEARKAFDAVKHGGNYIIQAKDATSSFSTVEDLLVPELSPAVVPEYFEARLVNHLPVISITSPSYQFIQHNFTGDSGGPGFTAEGTQKPQWEPSATKTVVTAQKLAQFFNLSSESIEDYPTWESYLINTGYQKIYQAENAAILYGTVSGSLGIQGWSTQTGILTHNAANDPSGSTNLDSLEIAINAMRVQSGVFAVPDLCIMSPTTWSFTRRLKSTIGTYLAGDPLDSPVHSVWGIPVIVTTAANDGDCFLVDSTKMGSVLVREGISMHMGYTGYGLVENVLTIVEEERLALATVIPSAVQYITGLAAS